MKFKNCPGFCLIVLVALAGCKKNGNSKPAAKTDVYVSGNVFVPGNATASEAVVWKNGVASHLPGLPGSGSARTYTMAADGNDLYVVGTTAVTDTDVFTNAVYWKNGIITRLDPGSLSSASAIGVVTSGTNIYVAGNVYLANPYAAYWKNGIVTNLADYNTYYASLAWGIAVSGTDVYVCGLILKNTGKSEAVYWKNGVLHELTDGSDAAYATSIVVQNSNVYITYSRLLPVTLGAASTSFYWKNGVAVQLPNNGFFFSVPGSITLNGADVYITGHLGTSDGQTTSAFWKNSVLQVLPGSGQLGSTNTIAISGTDVYLNGTANEGAKYWKNGVATPLGDEYTTANGIAVLH